MGTLSHFEIEKAKREYRYTPWKFAALLDKYHRGEQLPAEDYELAEILAYELAVKKATEGLAVVDGEVVAQTIYIGEDPRRLAQHRLKELSYRQSGW